MKPTFQSKLTYFLLLLLTISIFFSCGNNPNSHILYYKNGVMKELKVNNQEGGETVYLFYENGMTKAINKFDDKGLLNGEQLWFYPSGLLNRKVPFKRNKMQGSTFYFYDETGAVKGFRYFKNGKEILFGVEYWNDSIGMIKSSLHFNDSGQLYYKKNFDQSGNVLSEEGSRK